MPFGLGSCSPTAHRAWQSARSPAHRVQCSCCLLFINSSRSRLLIAPDFCSSKISSDCNLHRCCRRTDELPAHLKLQQGAACGHGSCRPPGPAPRGHLAAHGAAPRGPSEVRECGEEPHADAKLAAPCVQHNTPGLCQLVPGGSEHPRLCCCPWSLRRTGRLQGHAGTALCKATGFMEGRAVLEVKTRKMHRNPHH